MSATHMLVEAPIFHVAPPKGWVNDPNGPLFYNGRYHLFYQHLGNSASWSWGLSWGHVSSSDLVHWTRHPPALNPTPHSFDSDGCFSGCAVVLPAAEAAAAGLVSSNAHVADDAARTALEEDPAAAATASAADQQAGAANTSGTAHAGVPVLLYTGVVLRPDRDPSVRPSSVAVSELCIERQLAAVAAEAGRRPVAAALAQAARLLAACSSPDLCLNCFRDPFILEQPSPANDNIWRVMVGAGIRQHGTGLPCAGDTTIAAAAAALAAVCAAKEDAAAVATDDRTGGTAAAAASAAADGDTAWHADPRRAARGTALVYSSKQLLSGWQYEGPLCTSSRPEQGVVWECPVLAALPLQRRAAGQQAHCSDNSSLGATAAQAAHSHLFSISGGPRGGGLTGCVYWLGRYADGRFDLAAAAGPTLLDLGDLLYAPNLLTVQAQGGASRLLLWGWLSELPGHHQQSDNTSAGYAGSISLPRQLLLSPGGWLLQQPLAELALLHTGPAWSTAKLQLEQGQARHIGGSIPSSYFDLQVTLMPATLPADAAADGSTSCVAGVALPAWTVTTSSSSANSSAQVSGQGAILLYNFTSCELVLTLGPGVGAELLKQLDTPPASSEGDAAAAASADGLAQYLPASALTGQDTSHKAGSCAAAGVVSSGCSSAGLRDGVRQLRGNLRLAPGQPLQLRLLMDFSLLEVFCGDGQVMSTRLYRGVWPSSSSSDAAADAEVGDGKSTAQCSSDAGKAPATVAAALGLKGADELTAAIGDSSGDGSAAATHCGNSKVPRTTQPVDAACGVAAAVARGVAEMHGAYLVAIGGAAVAQDVSMHAMGTAWSRC